MFGKNKASLEETQAMQNALETHGQFFEQVSDSKKVTEALIGENLASHEQMENDIRQLQDNERNVCSYARNNVDTSATIVRSMEELQQKLEESEYQKNKLLEQIHEQSELISNLVEENKHLTSPSRYMQEIPGNLRGINNSYISQLEVMSDVGKKMGVLALNAAIEAGRMGDNGKQFVAAAEDVRVQAGLYDTIIAKMVEKIEESNKKVDEIEEQLHKVVGMLKDNNVAASKLMRDYLDTDKFAGRVLTETFATEVGDIRQKNIELKNSQEEIMKTEERNLMSLDDIFTENDTQIEKIREIETTVLPVLAQADTLKSILKEG